MTRLGILIPTRNRPDIALRALANALASDFAHVVVVSDNSTDTSRRLNAAAAGQYSESRVRFVSPPEPLPMSQHWEWAITRLLDEGSGLTHVTVLTDRMLYQPGAPEALRRVIDGSPDKVVSWGHDTVDDYDRPIRLYQEPWSGRRLRVPTSWVTAAASQGLLVFAPLPRLLNSVAPIEVVNGVRERYGTVFGSVAPDFCFAYRTLTIVDDFVFYDRSCVIQTHLDRSNGTNTARGVKSNDARDFRANIAGSSLSPDAPIPEIESLYNAIVNEYCFVNKESRGALAPLDHGGYLEHLARDIAAKSDSVERRHDEQLLRAAGWTGSFEHPEPTWLDRVRTDRSCVGSYRTGLAKGATRAVLGHHALRPAWEALARTGLRPYTAQRFHFRDTNDALEYALRHPRHPWHGHPHIAGLAGMHPELAPPIL